MKLIGLISPNLSEDTLVDVYKILPEGIRIEGRALDVGEYTDSEFQKAEQAFAGLVRELAQQPLDFLMATGELFLSYKGPGSDRQILAIIKGITATPASTVLTAVVHACQALSMRRVVMASPFPEDQDARLVRFLAHDNIDVVAYRGLGCENSNVIWALSPDTGYNLASSLLREFPNVDGLYMPCNKWRVISIIERIEREFGKPVVTNTQAWVWEALRAMGLTQPIPGYGRLLSSPERVN
jgi:maleate cis-trans isomerase